MILSEMYYVSSTFFAVSGYRIKATQCIALRAVSTPLHIRT